MKSIVFKITLAMSVLIFIALFLGTYFSGERMTALFYEYMLEAARLNDPYPLFKDGQILTGPAERFFLREVYADLMWIGLPITIIASLVSYAIVRGQTRTLSRLGRAAVEISKGNLDCKVETKEGGEVGLLANSFNFMADELSRAEELRKQFFADAAHELKTPIAVIKGNLEGMMDGVIPADRKTIHSLLEETDHLGNMVGDMKYLALADAGKLELAREARDVNAVAAMCAEKLTPSAKARGLQVEVSFREDPLMAFIDPERINQVVYNLLVNAGKYTPAGGSITLKTEKIIDGGAERAVIEVSDTGIGIAADDLPHIFDRFYRADKSRDRKTGGIGLGLSIVKKLVELHGGRVEVSSEVGKGSRFRVVIPVK